MRGIPCIAWFGHWAAAATAKPLSQPRHEEDTIKLQVRRENLAARMWSSCVFVLEDEQARALSLERQAPRGDPKGSTWFSDELGCCEKVQAKQTCW